MNVTNEQRKGDTENVGVDKRKTVLGRTYQSDNDMNYKVIYAASSAGASPASSLSAGLSVNRSKDTTHDINKNLRTTYQILACLRSRESSCHGAIA